MADTTFKIKRGLSGGGIPSGLTHGELAVNTTDNRLFVGSITGSISVLTHRFYTGTTPPAYPIEGDRWYTGTLEKFYYNGGWVNAGGASGSSGSFDSTQLLVFFNGASGSGGMTFAGGTRFFGGAVVQTGGLSVTGGVTLKDGLAVQSGGMSVQGLATFASPVNTVAGLSSNNLCVVNGATFDGPALFNGNVVINPDASRTLTVRGSATFQQAVKIDSGGLSVTGGATLTGGVALYGNVTVNGSPIGSGIANVPLASASQTGVASFTNDFVVSNLGAVSLTSNYVKSFNGSTGAVSFSTPLASSSATGVASFTNDFVVSNLGAVSLTSNYVKSFNGATGAVSYAVPLASSSATGVASFGSDFVVSALGAVSLTSNNVTTFNGKTGNVSFAVPVASSSATGVASFGNELVVSALGAVSLTSNYVKSFNGSTGAVSFATPLASSSATGVASFGNEFVVSNLGAVSLTSNYVKSVNGLTGGITGVAYTYLPQTFTGQQSFNTGVSANGLYVSNGATFANGLIVQAGGASITGGLSVTGGATLTGGVALYGNVTVNNSSLVTSGANTFTGLQTMNAGLTTDSLYVSKGATFASGLSVTGGTATFNAISVGNLTGAYFMAEQGFTAEFFYAPSIWHLYQAYDRQANQGIAFRQTSNSSVLYRWGADGLLSAGNGYGYSLLGNGPAIVAPPAKYDNTTPLKMVDVNVYTDSFGHLVLLSNKSLTGWGAIAGIPNFPPSGVNFIDIASGGSGNPSMSLVGGELAGWWLGLMENGRLTGASWPASSSARYVSTAVNFSNISSNPIFTNMPASLRSDATTGLTAKAILGSDDAYCYALLSDGSLTAWGATAFMLGGSGGAGTWTQGGTGGILSNFPSAGTIFTGFASNRAARTVGFAIKTDGNLYCFGYTGTTPIVSGSIASGIVDYRSIFCTNRLGDDQIVSVGVFAESYQSINSLWGTNINGSTLGPYFYNRAYNSSSDNRIFVGLTRGGSLTAGLHLVNQTAPFPLTPYPAQYTWPAYNTLKATGVTFSNVSCGWAFILAKRADTNVLVAFGPTNDNQNISTLTPYGYDGQTLIPTPFAQGNQTTVRFGGPVNISNAPLGQSDPYTQTPLLDVRGGIIAGQVSVASDSSLKSNAVDEQTGDGVVSFWKKDLLDNLAPKEFGYFGDPSTTKTIGYFAENAEAANPVYVTKINPININADRPPSETDQTNTPYSAINLNALMVGTIESLREMDIEMARIWTTESIPYPSKVKNGDLWYYPSENRLYIRKYETWIQVN